MKELDALQFYLPAVVAQHIANTERDEDGPLRPQTQHFDEIVCLFADMSGFTSLTEELCSLGPDGLEELSMNLNKFVTQIVKTVSKSGGDVLKFAGDAVITLWPQIDEGDYTQRVQRAVQCAREIQLRLDNFVFSVYEKDTEFRDVETLPDGKKAPRKECTLRVKLGLGCGSLNIMHLGGHDDLIQRERFEYLAIGQALAEAIDSENVAKPGEVVVSSTIWDKVGSFFVQEKKISGGHVIVKDWRAECRVAWKIYDRTIASGLETERKLWKYVPNAVMPYLLVSNDAFWAPELRTVTTLFFSLGLNMNEIMKGDKDEMLAGVFDKIQSVVLSYEGTINKFLVDDKGATLIAVFGLPPFGHEDDPLRGVLSGLKVLYKLSNYQLQGAVGIATGLAFCGIIGHASGNRREYSVIGDSVNLAARLMQNARSRKSTILIDSTTKGRLTNSSLDFYPVDVSVKGKREPVHCFQIRSGAHLHPEAHDFHSVHLARLGTLTQHNIRVTQQRTRWRDLNPSHVVVSPEEMMSLEEQQVKALNDTSGFFAKRRAAKARKHDRRHDKELSESTTQHLQHFAADEDDHEDADDDVFLARIRYRNQGDEIECTIAVSETRMETVLDLTEAAISNLINKGFIDPSASDPAYYELLWLRDNERTTLDPERLLSTLPFSSTEVLTMILTRFQSRRNIIASRNGPDPNGTDYIRSALAGFQEDVFAGNGSRLVVLSGEQGVGKTHLVENFLFSDDGAAYDEGEAIFAYARGNPFETGRRARPFAVWTHIMSELLDSAEGDDKSLTREDHIVRAIKAARRSYGPEVVAEDIEDRLYLLNDILSTSFEVPPGQFASSLLAPSSGSTLGRAAPKQTKKALGLAKSKTVFGANGKPTRLKALGMNWTPYSEDSLGRKGAAAGAASVGGAGTGSGVAGAFASQVSRIRHSLRRSVSFTNTVAAFVANPEAESVIRILATILGGLAARIPLTVVVDDSQYLDTFSLFVFQEIVATWNKSNVFIILLRRLSHFSLQDESLTQGNANERVSMFRPVPVKMHAAWEEHMSAAVREQLQARASMATELEKAVLFFESLTELEGVENLVLAARPSNTFDIICNCAQVDNMPEALISFIRKKTKGNPLYIADAIAYYTELELIERQTSPEPVLAFVGDEFERLANIHAVPIPLSVEAIVGALIDKMTLVQQLIIKVASIIGDVFTLGLVKSIFPIEHTDEQLEENFQKLIDTGVIVYARRDEGMAERKDTDKVKFSFESGWMVEILRHRMLNKQKRKLVAAKKRITKEWEEQQKLLHLEKAAENTFQVEHSGFLQIRKENARNIMSPWKPRWCHLRGHKLVQYYDSDEAKGLETIIIERTSEVSIDPIGYFGIESKLTPGAGPAPLYCFTIRTNRWIKKGKERGDMRTFTLGCENEEDRVQWVYKVQYEIDLLKIQGPGGELSIDASASESAASAGEMGGSKRSLVRATSVSYSSDPDAGREHLDYDDDAVQPKIASRPLQTRNSKTGMLKSVFGHGPRGSNGSRNQRKLSTVKTRPSKTTGVPGITYGVSCASMTPEAFNAISQAGTLEQFWEEPGSPSSTDHYMPNHSSNMYYECEGMSFVSQNSAGEIDGYIMGKLVVLFGQMSGSIDACAVLPWARRQGIGRSLYSRFFAACRGRDCRFVRCSVSVAHPIAIAFHRSLMFDEDEAQTERMARAGDKKLWFIKDLDGATQDEDVVEYENPLHLMRRKQSQH
ncbi:Adenylate cyclase type 10 [Hondaea fermentalgiana]|uniref:Adenylate cyclase type 10 n=1 Tax=Hondaea fermentalgiana TaxID=2315210 RepID=A0A2R5GZS9_9STRA|nr:Adenylate cyclase type 10 [Hondaea fermentalgiana]|eukprot:GBG33991.1 Adenylate cyclase type 10 [Hondaea fermentalgiana]